MRFAHNQQFEGDSRSTSTHILAHENIKGFVLDLSMYFPNEFQMALRYSSFQQYKGRCENLTHIGTTMGMYFSISNGRFHLLRYIHLGPMKYNPFIKMKSMCSFSKNVLLLEEETRKPHPQKFCLTFSLISHLQFLFIQNSMARGDG